MPTYKQWLHAYVVMVAGCTAVLIFAGGLVTTIGAGLAVPDWPLSFGSINPTGWWRQPLVREEHGHRLLGATVGLLTVILCVGIHYGSTDRRLRWLGISALILVIVQGVLGGLRVIEKNLGFAIIHACLAQIFFCLLVTVAWMTSSVWRSERSSTASEETSTIGDRGLAIIVGTAVFLQLVVGAIMRHTGAGLAISTFPLVDGGLIPTHWTWPVTLNYCHRGLGLAIVGLIWGWFARGLTRYPRFARRSLSFASALVILQIMLGGAAILTGRGMIPTTLHVLTGALILACVWSCILWLWHTPTITRDHRASMAWQTGASG